MTLTHDMLKARATPDAVRCGSRTVLITVQPDGALVVEVQDAAEPSRKPFAAQPLRKPVGGTYAHAA